MEQNTVEQIGGMEVFSNPEDLAASIDATPEQPEVEQESPEQPMEEQTPMQQMVSEQQHKRTRFSRKLLSQHLIQSILKMNSKELLWSF